GGGIDLGLYSGVSFQGTRDRQDAGPWRASVPWWAYATLHWGQENKDGLKNGLWVQAGVQSKPTAEEPMQGAPPPEPRKDANVSAQVTYAGSVGTKVIDDPKKDEDVPAYKAREDDHAPAIRSLEIGADVNALGGVSRWGYILRNPVASVVSVG